jgi:hypothetical protein
MAPLKKGFNLVGYFLPFVAIALAALLVFKLLRTWTRERQAAVAAAAGTPRVDASPEELERLREALRRDE